MKNSQLKTLTVIKNEIVTPNMRRITLGGDDINLFPLDSDGQYVKLRFLPDGGTDLTKLKRHDDQVLRTMTISIVSPLLEYVTIDIARHNTNSKKRPSRTTGGYVSNWAETANLGDTIHLVDLNQLEVFIRKLTGS